MSKLTNSGPIRWKGGRQGFTLLELVVVLFILAALAGVAVGVFGNFQKRTHGSTSASSIRNVDQVVTAELITGGQLGDNFDGLVTAAGAVPAFIANGNGLVPATLDAASAGALNELGITQVIAANATADNATLEGHDYDTPTTIAVADGEIIAQVAGSGAVPTLAFEQLVDDFNLVDVPDQIFAFGLGQESELVGANRTFKEAPLHTPGEGSAIISYGRYVILVGYETGGEAFYIGTTCIDDGENLNNVNKNLEEYFEAAG